MIIFLLTLLYVLAGLLLGMEVDEREMQQPVPYGEFPSIVPLSEWRLLTYLVFVFGGVPLVICAMVEKFLERRADPFS